MQLSCSYWRLHSQNFAFMEKYGQLCRLFLLLVCCYVVTICFQFHSKIITYPNQDQLFSLLALATEVANARSKIIQIEYLREMGVAFFVSGEIIRGYCKHAIKNGMLHY